MVDEKGSAKTYAIVDVCAQTLVAGCHTIQDAMKAERTLGGELAIHNVTHPKCPDWLKAMIMADAAYCAARAAEYQDRSGDLRRKAAAIIEEADQAQAISDRYAQAAENAASAEAASARVAPR
ncbi:hypothetical protein [Azospirillum griseum]|uniref:Uncharacterized protein n=1 Tax=Azospirillum griseum TaxID=2496639 RepID=A0A3S0K0S8_9PROT|nr:hypothetical protein [Azospirillum griseum]RTR11618.1 hypothetical protein EJ903_26025 [Azospirillum griseum]